MTFQLPNAFSMQDFFSDCYSSYYDYLLNERVCWHVPTCVVRFLCVFVRLWHMKIPGFSFASLPVLCASAVGIITPWIPRKQCVLSSIMPKKVGMFSPGCANKWLSGVARLHLGRMCPPCVRKCLCRVVGVCADASSFFFFFFLVRLNMCVYMCVSDFVAFVTKHPRCHTDSAGQQRKKNGSPAQEVFLHCCTAAIVCAWASSVVVVEKLQQAGRRNSVRRAKGWRPFQIFSCNANFTFFAF